MHRAMRQLSLSRSVTSRSVAGSAASPARASTPNEPRHSFVSLTSDEGVPIEQIALLVGHTGFRGHRDGSRNNAGPQSTTEPP